MVSYHTGKHSESRSLSTHDQAPGYLTSVSLPFTPFSPSKSHFSSSNMPSMLPTWGLCASCPSPWVHFLCLSPLPHLGLSSSERSSNHLFQSQLFNPSLLSPLSHFIYLPSIYYPMAFCGYWFPCLWVSSCSGMEAPKRWDLVHCCSQASNTVPGPLQVTSTG